LKNDQYDKARTLIRQYLHKFEATPRLYALLAEAEGKSGDRSATHQAMAEQYFLNGDNTAAVNQLQLALEQGQHLNNNERLRLQSRLKEIQQLIAAEPGQ
jgi:predicted Zn-dependent protease